VETLGNMLNRLRFDDKAFFMKLTKKTIAAKRQRRKPTAEFKAKVALSALWKDKTLAELCK